jgi:hypothetical protein
MFIIISLICCSIIYPVGILAGFCAFILTIPLLICGILGLIIWILSYLALIFNVCCSGISCVCPPFAIIFFFLAVDSLICNFSVNVIGFLIFIALFCPIIIASSILTTLPCSLTVYCGNFLSLFGTAFVVCLTATPVLMMIIAAVFATVCPCVWFATICPLVWVIIYVLQPFAVFLLCVGILIVTMIGFIFGSVPTRVGICIMIIGAICSTIAGFINPPIIELFVYILSILMVVFSPLTLLAFGYNEADIRIDYPF